MKIERKNVVEQLTGYFIDCINSERWRVGEKIPSENQLSKELGVSRSSIRQTVSQFAALGILETRQGRGTMLVSPFVDSLTQDDVRLTMYDYQNAEKVLEFRRIVESEACAIAASNAGPELVEYLNDRIDDMLRNRNNVDAYIEADISFHQSICNATDNPVLMKTMAQFFADYRNSQLRTWKERGYQAGINSHQEIVDAIASGDPEAARKAMYKHLQDAIDRIIENKKNIHSEKEA